MTSPGKRRTTVFERLGCLEPYRYEDGSHETVHMGDTVDVCEDVLGYDFNVHSVVRSGVLVNVVYGLDGFLDMVVLADASPDGGERYVDFDGCFYHHEEDADD